MLSDLVLNLTLFFLLAICGALGSLVTAARGARARLLGRRSVVHEGLRQAVLELAAGDRDERDAALATLTALDRRQWAAVAPSVLSLLLKLKGESHQALVGLLSARGELDRAAVRLNSRSPIKRAEAAELLGTSGYTAAVPALIALLEDRDQDVRQVAARALGRIAAPAAIGPLLATIGSATPVPHRLIASAVWHTGLAAHPELDRVLRFGSQPQRAVAAELCGLVGASSCLGILADTVEWDPALEVRIRAVRSLGKLGVPRIADTLIRATYDDRPTALRAVAARALGDLGAPETVARLAVLAVDLDDRVAVNASASLLQCGARGVQALRALAANPAHLQCREALATARLRRLVEAETTAEVLL